MILQPAEMEPETPQSDPSQSAPRAWKMIWSNDLGLIKWDKPIATAFMVGAWTIPLIKCISAEPDGESHGQIFITHMGSRYTMMRGGHIMYKIPASSASGMPGFNVLRVDGDAIRVDNRPESRGYMYISAEYFESITVAHIKEFNVYEPKVTIFHAGFPHDAKPAILPLGDLISIAQVPIVTADGEFGERSYHVKTEIALTNADVDMLQYMVCDYKSGTIGVHDISEELSALLTEWRMKIEVCQLFK